MPYNTVYRSCLLLSLRKQKETKIKPRLVCESPPLCTRHGKCSASNRRKHSSSTKIHPLAEGMLVLYFTPAFVGIPAPSSRKRAGRTQLREEILRKFFTSPPRFRSHEIPRPPHCQAKSGQILRESMRMWYHGQGNTLPLLRRPTEASKIAVHKLRKARLGTP